MAKPKNPAKPKKVAKPKRDPAPAGTPHRPMATRANGAAVAPAPSSDDTPQDRQLLHSLPIAAADTTHLLQLLSSAGKNGSKAYWPKRA